MSDTVPFWLKDDAVSQICATQYADRILDDYSDPKKNIMNYPIRAGTLDKNGTRLDAVEIGPIVSPKQMDRMRDRLGIVINGGANACK